METSLRHLIDSAIVLMLIVGLWRFRAPKGARSGNRAAALALLCAVGVVLYEHPVLEPGIVIPAIAFGSLVGWIVAVRINMVGIPAMVGFQNGAGGGAAFLVAIVELTRDAAHLGAIGKVFGLLGLVTGAVTFAGSMIAGGKLANILRQAPVILPLHGLLLLGSITGIVVLGPLAAGAAGAHLLYSLMALAALSIALGILFSIRIGGADMPVWISFLNAMTGLAAAFCGIMVQNRLLIACGTMVGASGSILTHVMCKAMNRRLFRVLVGIRPGPAPVPHPLAEDGSQELSPELAPSQPCGGPLRSEEQDALARAVEAAKRAEKVVIIPGYGMALAQAQFAVVKLAKRLEEMGKDVKFAIHPVAGRMPGHMNVLLAEAEVDYDKLLEMDEVNPNFRNTDLALIVGACDVVNPAAIDAEGTPISGMPILMAHEAKRVIACNLDDSPGYSGVANPLYANPKAILLFGDAKATVGRLLQELD